ncbi:MAG: HAD-IC family P-type ATPase [Carbonactinosporaceae bacterium]
MAGLEGVRWAEVIVPLGRAVVAFDDDLTPLDELLSVVDDVEGQFGPEVGDGLPVGGPAHPGDLEPIIRGLAEIGGDVLGLGLGMLTRLVPSRLAALELDVAMLTSLIENSPRLRGPLEARFGDAAAEVVLTLANGVAQGLAGSTAGPLVDIAHRTLLLLEATERRGAWIRNEPILCAAPSGGHNGPQRRQRNRPVPVPPGPIEAHAEATWVASLGAFGVSLGLTRNLQRSAAVLYSGLPKAARLGREAFASRVGRTLAKRGVIPMDPAALRLLDRVDSLVIDAEGTLFDGLAVAEVIPVADVGADAARRRAQALFDPRRPEKPRSRAGWGLGPLESLGNDVPWGFRGAANRLRGAGGPVLGLTRRGALVALLATGPLPRAGAEELVGAARGAGLAVLIAARLRGPAARLGPDRVVSTSQRGLAREIRRLQLEGHVVAAVVGGTSAAAAAAAAADVTLGLRGEHLPVPWSADLLCPDEDLAHALVFVEACAAARRASRQSAALALAGGAAAGALAFGGPPGAAIRRVMSTLNVAAAASLVNGTRLGAGVARTGPVIHDPTPWHALEPARALRELGSSWQGLAQDVASGRRSAPSAARASAPLRLVQAVTGEIFTPLTPVLAGGAAVSAAVGGVADAAMVAGAVGFNAVVSGVERFRADRAVERLLAVSGEPVATRRGGADSWVAPAELVPGDVIALRSGDVVPADCRILESAALEVDESRLTGESLPVSKGPEASFAPVPAERSSMLYEGTAVAAGEALAVVVAVGDRTEAARGHAPAGQEPPARGVESRLSSLTALTTPLAIGSGLALAVVGALRGRPGRELAAAGVSLAVAAVPEGLPLLATTAQLAAARRLSARGVLVRNPRSLEALGRVDVVCADKTGTLTEGTIQLRRISDGVTEHPLESLPAAARRVLAAGLRASPDDHLDVVPHATDRALIEGARRAGVRLAEGAPGWDFAEELPFEPARGFHAVLGTAAEARLLSVKGAPEVVLPRCGRWLHPDGVRRLDEAGRRELEAQAMRLARRGLRVLAVAERSGPGEGDLVERDVRALTFLGFAALADPVRAATRDAVTTLRAAGIEVVMITGDHPSTAEGIASELDLVDHREIMTGAELDLLTDGELDASLPGIAVFARVTPAHKVRIVGAYQRAGRVVAMTGDGANDAPAIRLADVGTAFGARATQAARDAADIVVTDDRVEMIVDAVLEGRAMWSSVREAVAILVGGNLGEIAFILGGTLLGGRSPLNARQLLLVNFLTDVAPAMAIALRPPRGVSPEDLLREGPEASLASPLSRSIAERAAVTAAGATVAHVVARYTGTTARAGTVALVALVGSQLGQTLVAGGRDPVVVAAALGSAGVLAGIVQTPGVSQVFGCCPLGPLGWAQALGAACLATTAAAVWPLTRVRAKGGSVGVSGPMPSPAPQAT